LIARMTCRDRDMDLTLLCHGELTGVRYLLTTLHLARCPRCQERKAEIADISQLIGRATRGPDMPPWRIAELTPTDRFRNRLTRLLLAAALIVTLATIGIGVDLATHHAASPAHSASPAPGCRPDLPNDRCR